MLLFFVIVVAVFVVVAIVVVIVVVVIVVAVVVVVVIVVFGHLVFIIVGADGEGILRGFTLYLICCCLPPLTRGWSARWRNVNGK